MGAPLILIAFIVSFGLIPVQPKDLMREKVVTNTVDGSNKIQTNFRRYFDSITKNDDKNRKTYRNILERETAREQHAFDTMKGELNSARQKNAHVQRNSLKLSKRESTNHYYGVGKRLAVTPLAGAEKFYVQIKTKRQPSAQADSETPKTKIEICANIIDSSPFLAHEDLEVVRILLEGVSQIQTPHPHIMDNLSAGAKSEYNNSYESREIKVEGAVLQERVFSCIVRNRKSDQISEYFISPEYNVNEWDRETAPQLMGRFVFTEDDADKKLVVTAVAEAPGQKLTHEAESVEHLFIDDENDENQQSAKRRHLICEMTPFQKTRLCTLILSSNDSIELSANKDNAAPKCEHRDLHFEHYTDLHYVDDYEQWSEIAPPIKEYMLACTGTHKPSGQPATYFVSRGFVANIFYVAREYHIQKNVTLLDHISSKVSVVPASYNL